VAYNNLPLLERFWQKVRKGAPNECWMWTGTKNNKRLAHRIAYELFIAPVQPGLCALHRCDNPACVNPAHLFLGTKKDNMQDCKAKGRTRNGVRLGTAHHFARFTPRLVRSIRRRVSAGETYRGLAREFGVSPSSIKAIWLRKNWAHVL
jgi:hypothetical protein